MRRMISQNKIEVVNHLNATVNELITDLQFGAPRIDLTSPVISGIASNYNIDFLAAMDPEEGDYSVEVQLTNEGIIVDPDFNVTGECYLTILNLPTSDPGVKNALWNDNGTLKISSGN